MGWFSSDEIIQTIDNDTNKTLQTVALIILAVVVLAYGLIKVYNNHHRNQAERVATAAVRMSTLKV